MIEATEFEPTAQAHVLPNLEIPKLTSGIKPDSAQDLARRQAHAARFIDLANKIGTPPSYLNSHQTPSQPNHSEIKLH
jgi:hypothetical protein